jgi:UDP-N-acetylmuramoyl-L-alanyl-D-glutamate--2,6-diaminopimelate ligase
MMLADLLAGMNVVIPDDAGTQPVVDITGDSRRVICGGLFMARAGACTHGLAHIAEALDNGVAVVVWEPADGVAEPELPAGVISIALPRLGSHLGTLADRFFGSPSSALTVTGVTGTNGKSTTAWLVAHALTALGREAGYMGTLGYGVLAGSAEAKLQTSSLTTPGCIEVHRRLRGMLDAGAKQVVMEVSSHALDQGRVDGVRFDVAALTNISRDHLDYHGDMDHYAEAKARLFVGTGIRTAVINTGDVRGVELAARVIGKREGAEVLTVALVDTPLDNGGHDGPDARLIGRLVGAHADGIGVRFTGDFGEAMLDSPLWGRFNAENLVVSTGMLLAQGVSLDAAVGALRAATAPTGRMELVRGTPEQPVVVVDYAHTPAALGEAIRATREHITGQVWCVFGCGGDRDRGKRAQMGAVAAEFADRSVITDDNPRNEDPAAIIADIQSGLQSRVNPTARMEVIRERGDAISFAIRSAGANDAVLIAGKGHEAMQVVGDDARPFSDRDAARTALGGVA